MVPAVFPVLLSPVLPVSRSWLTAVLGVQRKARGSMCVLVRVGVGVPAQRLFQMATCVRIGRPVSWAVLKPSGLGMPSRPSAFGDSVSVASDVSS